MNARATSVSPDGRRTCSQACRNAACGAGFIMTGRNRLACVGARDKGACGNHLTIRRGEVEPLDEPVSDAAPRTCEPPNRGGLPPFT